MKLSKIEWTESTWNPTTGCTKISSGCLNCYAEVMTRRLNAMGVDKYQNGFTPNGHYKELLAPYSWKKPRMVFVNSMSDLFHEDIPFNFVKAVFKVMNDCQQHTFQVLTKRADMLEKYYTLLDWTPNIWMGVTVENDRVINRVDSLRKVPAIVKFLSIEPLISALPELNLLNIDWVIVGGESGPQSRPIKEEWVVNIQKQCEKKQIPFFFKQWGGTNKKKAGRELNGTGQTGTGKQSAYLLLVMNHPLKNHVDGQVGALIVVPTRELAIHISKHMEGLSYFTHLSSIAIYGGNDAQSFVAEKKALQMGADIIVCTPGRMIAHVNMGYVNLKGLRFIVFD